MKWLMKLLARIGFGAAPPTKSAPDSAPIAPPARRVSWPDDDLPPAPGERTERWRAPQ